MRNMALGRYIPVNSPMHRMDSRIKIIGLIVFMVSVFLSFGSTAMNFIVYGLLFIAILVMMIVGKVSFIRVLKSLKALWFMMFFLLIVNVFLVTTGDIAFYIYKLPIYWSAIFNTSYVVVRLVLMLMLTTVLTATTKPMDLTNGLRWLLTPFKLVKLPIDPIAMTISLALRFIPTLTEDTDRIMKAQASRGVDFRNGKFKEKIKAIVSLIVPLFMSAISRSGELADTMESRGYNPDAKRTSYRTVKWGIKETISLIILLLILGGFITMAVLRFDLIALIQGMIK